MKKVMILCMSLVLAVTLFGCGKSETETKNGNKEEQNKTASQSGKKENKKIQTQEVTGSNILVVYFSAAENDGIDGISSATLTEYEGKEYGATQLASKYIKDYVGADTFSIVTQESYPDDYELMKEKAKEQQDNEEKPELASRIQSFENYQTLFFVYPIWHDKMPMAFYSLMDEYDFSGKTIVPVAINDGSGISGTIEEIKSLEPTAVVADQGYEQTVDNINNSKEDIENWLEEISAFWKEV